MKTKIVSNPSRIILDLILKCIASGNTAENVKEALARAYCKQFGQLHILVDESSLQVKIFFGSFKSSYVSFRDEIIKLMLS